MCDQTYTVATGTALAMHKSHLVLGLLSVIYVCGCLWIARCCLRRPPPDWKGPPYRREWAEFAVSLFSVFLASGVIWAITTNFASALRFTIDGPDIVAVEIDTMNTELHVPDKVIRTTRIDDPAELCRLIELLRAAPVGDWQGATGMGDEYYRVRFVKADGTYAVNWLEVIPNGRHKKGINIVLLLERKQHSMALHSPAINEWLQSQLAARQSPAGAQ